ncbi:acyltransferase [Gammaproteobacteria bacterium]|nr:acyltransferase [Gammaproteobacteria bacterium]
MNYIGETFYSDDELKKFNFKYLGKNVKIKKNVGIFFCENISLSDDVRIDDFSIIVGSGKGLLIDNNVHFAAKAYLICYGGIKIDSFCTFGPNVSIFSASDDYKEGFLSNGTVDDEFKKLDVKEVKIGKGSIVGPNSTLLPGSSMGFGSSLGAHSLLKLGVPDYDIYAGVPAKKIGRKDVYSPKILELLNKSKS